MRTTIRSFTKALAVASLCLSFATAWAQANPVEEARQRFKRGAELYDENNFRAALVEFQRAYELSSNYKLLYNMGQVQMQLLDYASALSSFHRYLTEGGNEVPATRREEVNRDVERLKSRVGKILIETLKGNEVLIDDVTVGYAPLAEATVVNTGRHKVTVNMTGKAPVSRVVDVAGLQTVTVTLANEAEAPAPVAAVSAPAASGKVRSSAIITWVAAGGLAIGAAVMGLVGFGAATELARIRGDFGTTRETLLAQSNKAKTFSAVSDVMTVGALVAGGVALWLTLSPADAPATAWLGVGPQGVTVRGSF